MQCLVLYKWYPNDHYGSYEWWTFYVQIIPTRDGHLFFSFYSIRATNVTRQFVMLCYIKFSIWLYDVLSVYFVNATGYGNKDFRYLYLYLLIARPHTHAHTHTHIYIYICVPSRLWFKHLQNKNTKRGAALTALLVMLVVNHPLLNWHALRWPRLVNIAPNWKVSGSFAYMLVQMHSHSCGRHWQILTAVGECHIP